MKRIMYLVIETTIDYEMTHDVIAVCNTNACAERIAKDYVRENALLVTEHHYIEIKRVKTDRLLLNE